MKKIIITILFCSLFSSCTKVYDLSERLTLDVHVIDENNVAMENVNVDIFVDSYSSIFFPDDFQGRNTKTQTVEIRNDLISFNETDSEGKARLHFPRDGITKNNNYKVLFSKEGDGLKPLNVYIQIIDFQDYYIEIPPQKIYAYEALTQLFITTELDENYRLEMYSLTGNIAYDFITTNEFSNPKKFTNQDIIDVEKNQSILLKYSLSYFENGVNSTVNEEVVIEIGNEPVEFSIQNP